MAKLKNALKSDFVIFDPLKSVKGGVKIFLNFSYSIRTYINGICDKFQKISIKSKKVTLKTSFRCFCARLRAKNENFRISAPEPFFSLKTTYNSLVWFNFSKKSDPSKRPLWAPWGLEQNRTKTGSKIKWLASPSIFLIFSSYTYF